MNECAEYHSFLIFLFLLYQDKRKEKNKQITCWSATNKGTGVMKTKIKIIILVGQRPTRAKKE
jgi:hypothetical protein